MAINQNKRGTKAVFVGVIVILILVCASIGFVGYNNTNNLQTENVKIKSELQSLNATYTDLQSNYSLLQSNYGASQNTVAAQASNISELQSQVGSLSQQISSLNQQLATSQSTIQSQTTTLASQTSQIANLQNQIASIQSQLSNATASSTNLQNQITGLNNVIASLQSQLSNATALIAQLQGPTGILPTFMDLGYVAPTGQPSYYFLQLSLKNTGSVPITQIFVTINSVQLTIPFTYLGTTVSVNAPLPSYQTATGSLHATPPINNLGTYPLIIQAIAANSTIYTYQTTISAHL